MADEQKTGTAEDAASTAAATFGARIGEIVKWLVGGLAVVASAAVTSLGLDRLGTGDPGDSYTLPIRGWEVSIYLFWALVSVALFTIGVVVIMGAVVWLARSRRVTLDYLIDAESSIAQRVRKSINSSQYLLGGQEDLACMRTELNRMMCLPRPLTDDDHRALVRLLNARETVLETAKAERTRHVSGRAVWIIGVGAVVASVSAATFAYVVNRSITVRDDRLTEEKEVVVGELLPHTPSDVLLVVPEDAPDRAQIAEIVGVGCDLSSTKAVLFEVATPPEDAVPASQSDRVLHVVIEASDTCDSTSLWVAPEWVVARPADDGESDDSPESDDGADQVTTTTEAT